MTVFRTSLLQKAPAKGRLIVPRNVVDGTLAALREFRGSDGRHEGLVFWAGRVAEPYTDVLAFVVPECDHGPQHVTASEMAIGDIARLARRRGLGLVAQVHSHPGDDTRHSDGDDRLVLMPFEGMFSLVVASYGAGTLEPGQGVGVQQFQGGRWVQVDPVTDDVITILPDRLEGPTAWI